VPEVFRKAGSVVFSVLAVTMREMIFWPSKSRSAKSVFGSCLFGASGPSRDIHLMLRTCQSAQIKPHELIATIYIIDEFNQGYAGRCPGKHVSGVIIYDCTIATI